MIRSTTILSLVLAGTLAASPSPEAKTTGIDWIKGEIIARTLATIALTPQGRPQDERDGSPLSLNHARREAYRSAREQALVNLARIIPAMRVDADTTIADILERDTVSRERLGDIMQRKLRMLESPGDFFSSTCRASLVIAELIPAMPYQYPGDDFPLRTDNPIPTQYTALIIDTRGLGIQPMIFPSVFSAAGLELYGRNFVDIRQVSRQGIASYAYTEQEAMKHRRAGEHPYFSIALRGFKGCPVISDQDTRKIFSGTRTLENLKQCRVIFIIDRSKN